MTADPHYMTDTQIDEFWDKIAWSDDNPGGCWIWHDSDLEYFRQRADRLAYYLVEKTYPSLEEAMIHCCNQPACCNPEHMCVRRYSPEAIIERFWSLVNIPPRKEGCWLWGGESNKVHYNDRWEAVARVAYILNSGTTPHGLDVEHTCGTELCCNPEHLVLRPQKWGTPR
jgi:hypothetical protein